MSAKTCLITGATSGIGRATAVELGRLGWDLWLVGRDERRGAAVARDIEKLGRGGRVRFLRADISSLAEVRALADDVRRDAGHLDVLVNNAGARILRPGRSVDGVELTFATNHLGHFVLTLLLIDLLARAEAGRVINVSSSAHHAGRGDFAAVLSMERYDGRKAYAEAKLANVLFTRELSRRLQGTAICVNAVDPGGVATRFAKNNGLIPWMRHYVAYARHGKLLTPKRGCRTVVYLASSEAVAGASGGYYFDGRPAEMSAAAKDNASAFRLWLLSLKLAGIRPQEITGLPFRCFED